MKMKLSYIRDNKYPIMISLLASFLLLPSSMHIIFNPLGANYIHWASIDPSWMLAINYAKINNLVFGSDIIFTYGPLSYLSTRVAWGINKYSFLAYDIFCFLNYYFLIYYTYKNAKAKLYYLMILILSLLCVPLFSLGGQSLSLFVVFLFWLNLCIKNYRPYFLIPPIMLAILLFFVKLNTAFVALLALILTISYLYYRKNLSLRDMTIAIIILVLSLVMSANVLNVSLVGYIRSGINLIYGYNEVMYGNNEKVYFLKIVTLFVYLSSCFLLFYEKVSKKNLKKYLLITLPHFVLFTIGFFILYKQTFVRVDDYHIIAIFSNLLFLLIAMNLVFNYKWSNSRYIVLLVPVLFIFHLHYSRGIEYNSLTKKIDKRQYLSQLINYSNKAGMEIFNKPNELPDDVLETIGESTVDVFPWNIHMLIENKLNYAPRPVIQSYSAYTKYLAELNFNYYNSDKAPRYVILDIDSIDGRYPIFDESKTYLVLQKKYKPIKEFKYLNRNLLLLKKDNENSIVFSPTRKYVSKINETIALNYGRYYEITINKNALNHVASLIDHSPEIITLIAYDSKSLVNRTSIPLLKSGIYSTSIIESTNNFLQSYNEDTANNDIRYISFNINNRAYYKEDIEIIEYEVTQR